MSISFEVTPLPVADLNRIRDTGSLPRSSKPAESVIEDLLSRDDVAFVHSRNPLAGCYMFAISRAENG